VFEISFSEDVEVTFVIIFGVW